MTEHLLAARHHAMGSTCSDVCSLLLVSVSIFTEAKHTRQSLEVTLHHYEFECGRMIHQDNILGTLEYALNTLHIFSKVDVFGDSGSQLSKN